MASRGRIFSVAIFIGFASHSMIGQSSPTEPAVAEYCATIAHGIPHAEALQYFCNWVASFDTKLPNIIGDQATYRYSTDNGKDLKLMDTTSARIAYIDGRPHVSDLAINHVKIPESADASELTKFSGAWSYTDYGSDLRMLFGSHTNTHFSYAGETSWRGIPVVAFAYEMRREDNHRWQMKAREKPGQPLASTYPGYAGRILLDRQTSALLRFERHTTEIEKHFPLRFGSNQVNYQRVALGDGTFFVLPVESIVSFCHDEKHRKCEVNDTTFANWQKFGAKTRILTGTQPE